MGRRAGAVGGWATRAGGRRRQALFLTLRRQTGGPWVYCFPGNNGKLAVYVGGLVMSWVMRFLARGRAAPLRLWEHVPWVPDD